MANRKYIDDYRLEEPGNRRSKVIYVGEYYYRFEAEGKDYKKLRACFVVMPLIMMALFAVMGILNNTGMNQFYVAVPYAVMFLPIFLMLLCDIDIFTNPREMTRKLYNIGVKRLKNCTVAVFIIGLMTLFGIGYLLISKIGTGIEYREIIFTALLILLLTVDWLFMGVQAKYRIMQIANSKNIAKA